LVFKLLLFCQQLHQYARATSGLSLASASHSLQVRIMLSRASFTAKFSQPHIPQVIRSDIVMSAILAFPSFYLSVLLSLLPFLVSDGTDRLGGIQ
jgi:hypothetical protein